MNILVDIGHPAHVHLTKNVIRELLQHGHNVIVTTKDSAIITRLLQHENLTYIIIGKKGKSFISKLIKQLSFDYKIWKIVNKNHIDVALGTSMTIPRISKISKMSSINLDDDDDEVQPISVLFSHPFSDVRLTPLSLKLHRKSSKAIFYSGTHELAYLHPKYFSPDETVLERAGLNKNDTFFILRFVAFNAYHDVGQGGLSIEQKRRLINLLLPHGRVIITSEKPLDDEFELYRMPVPPEDIHSLMYYSSMFLGDSQTMTSEAAILGIPALKCNTFAGRLSVPNELEQKYGLCYSYLPEQFDDFIKHVQSILENPHAKKEWNKKRQKFLSDKIDVTAFFVWFVENYPESKRIMKENPDYQYNFR